MHLSPSQPFINEAIITLETGIASKEDIDTTLKLGMAHPMGPLQLADLCVALSLSLSSRLLDEGPVLTSRVGHAASASTRA